MDLLYDSMSGAQIDLFDDARLSIDPGRTHPIYIGITFFPLSYQTWHTIRVIHSDNYVN